MKSRNLTQKLQEDNQNYKQKITQQEQTIHQKQQRILALEADKQDLFHQLTQTQQKYQNHLTQEKQLIQQEIQLIKEDKFLAVDILTYELNGLEEPINLTIQYRDGKEALVRTKAEQEELTKNLTKEEKANLSFLDPSEVVYRNKSRKKVFLFCENDPSDETQAKKITASQEDYLFYIADPSTTNEIKDYEVYSPSQGKEERKQLHEDYTKDFSELRRVFGIRHLTSKKEDRQNNPEIELNEAQFVALEREK
ncbi:3967_t:CDS:2 [Entrophospora sp. SA101]|nr:3967_t:CDS:2 [Entrophospora sp. SA101]